MAQVRDFEVSAYQALTLPRVPGCKRQKCLLELRVLPTVLRRGYIHGEPVFLVSSVSATYTILTRFSNAAVQLSSLGLLRTSPPT